MTEKELYEAAYAMEREGGGFASAIAIAFYRADKENRKLLLQSFMPLFERFYNISRRQEQAQQG